MGTDKEFGEAYRKKAKGETPPGICEICGGDLDMDPESNEGHCPVCESPEE